MVIGLGAVSDHDRDILLVPLLDVAVRVEEDAHSAKLILVSEDWAGRVLLGGVPHGKAVPVQLGPLAVHVKLDRQLKT